MFSIFRMNRYTGGPNRNANKTNMTNSSRHPIAITGSQASIPSQSTDKPIQLDCFMQAVYQEEQANPRISGSPVCGMVL
jgi:hypothetical protein